MPALDMNAAALQLKVRGQECVYTSGWPSWMHIENFSAWHNVPIGTQENGMAGMDTKFAINSPLHVRHLTMLGDMSKKGLFTYAGRTNQAEAKFASGECAMLTSSTGAQANFRQNAKFDWSVNFIPYHDDVKGAPQNSIIGGASLWIMGVRRPRVLLAIAFTVAAAAYLHEDCVSLCSPGITDHRYNIIMVIKDSIESVYPKRAILRSYLSSCDIRGR